MHNNTAPARAAPSCHCQSPLRPAQDAVCPRIRESQTPNRYPERKQKQLLKVLQTTRETALRIPSLINFVSLGRKTGPQDINSFVWLAVALQAGIGNHVVDHGLRR